MEEKACLSFTIPSNPKFTVHSLDLGHTLKPQSITAPGDDGSNWSGRAKEDGVSICRLWSKVDKGRGSSLEDTQCFLPKS